ncbi:MAG: hypothetical protein H6937_06415 [Burkholderiales bacterium]|nr:hypothetical protein [Burkholderiales bacterium]MDR4515970.1 hypothetical protein [Nitrosomonas sp.]
MNNKFYQWRFFRSGGFDQVCLDCADDLKSLETLDQKLWAALSCPTNNLEIDSKTLELIDTDGDGHIRVPEIIAAVNWTTTVLKNPEDMMHGSEVLPLAAINENDPEGAVLLASAQQILSSLNKADAIEITIADTEDLNKIFSNTHFNGDGIITPSATPDIDSGTAIKEIIECVGYEEDRSGQPGVSLEKVNHFFTEAHAYVQWWHEAESQASLILPLGSATAAGKAVFDQVKDKVDDYFTRCRLAA